MSAQSTAIIASFLLGAVVVIVVSNLILSQRGAGFVPRDISLRFASLSVIFYLIVSLQGSLQANMQLNELTHFTDWVIGHSHLAMLGFATLAGIAGIVHAWQRLPDTEANVQLLDWSYWLLAAGITAMVIDLSLAGLVQGALWQSASPWLESLRASRPYWIVRSLSAVPVILGFGLLAMGLLARPADRTEATPSLTPVASGPVATLTGQQSNRALAMSYLVASVAGVAFFVLSVSLLGVLPLQSLQQDSLTLAPAPPLALTASELRGRAIYAREGCSYCHTQQIRFVDSDAQRFGAPTLAWEGRLDYPHMLGTRRVGPDLSRASGTRSQQWQLAHLFSPRSVVPLSIMPSYAEFFDGSPLNPRQEALDLVAYLETLGRARELAWPEGDLRGQELAVDNSQALRSLRAEQLNSHPARTQPRGNVPEFHTTSSAASEPGLWQDNCSGCHGASGLGDGPAAQWLKPAPTNLSQHRYTRDMLADILWNGVHGTSMPGWRDRSSSELARLISVVQGYSTVVASAADPVQLATGSLVYQQHCVECHGESGRGDGFAVGRLPQPVPPTDFTREQLSVEESLRVLRNGVAGTSMAPWRERLSDEEMTAVSHYLRSLFQADEYGSEEQTADD